MADELRLEMRHAIHFCIRLGDSPIETFTKLKKAYGSECLSRTTCFEWHKRFTDGRESASDDSRSGRPHTSTSPEMITRCREIVDQDRRVTVENLSQTLDISIGSTHSLLVDHLKMRRVCALWVPRILTEEQRAVRVQICHDMLNRFEAQGETFLDSIVTVDESWMHHFELETKFQSSVWKHTDSPPPKKAIVKNSAGKVMHMVFFDRYGLVYDHAVPRKTTVTSSYYSTVLKSSLLRHLRMKRPEKLKTGCVLHHDNAPAHTARLTQECLREMNVDVLPHPPYSPDLAPCDFWLFPTVKNSLRGRKFSSDEELNSAVRVKLRTLCSEGLYSVFDDWVKRWQRCCEAEGAYFEKE